MCFYKVDFGEILDQWDKYTGLSGKAAPPGKVVPVYNKDTALGTDFSEPESSASRRRRLLRKRPEASIDLHGLTRNEAWNALTVFFDDAKNKALEKVLVIHGKGNHAPETGTLKKMVREFIERCPFAGESGYSDAISGGTGSTWVLLKKAD